jgi:branched-chain amino acid transport system substrate-binding protein
MIFSHIFTFIISLLLLAGCNVDYEAMAKQRIEYAKKNQGEIVIAAIQGSDDSHYIKGISLAVEEINQSKNQLLGRPLKLQLEPGYSDFKSAKSTIRRIADNPKISVVLGHIKDEIVLPASVIYEKSQLLFFPPFTTTEALTSHKSLFTFRMLPDNIDMAEQISNLSKTLGFTKVAVLYSSTDRHRELGLLLKKRATNTALSLEYSYSFFEDTDDYRSFLSDLKKKEFDAVLISASAKTAARLVKQMREMGVDRPILGSGDLNSQEFKLSVGLAGNNTIVPTPYNALADNRISQNFIARYRAKYKQLPDADAAQGYDSVMLFANKAARAQSTVPALLASIVRFSPQWTGTTGNYRFNKEGNLEGKGYFFQVLNNEDWQPLSTLHPNL